MGQKLYNQLKTRHRPLVWVGERGQDALDSCAVAMLWLILKGESHLETQKNLTAVIYGRKSWQI